MNLTQNVILARPVVGCPLGCDFCYAKKANERECWIGDFNNPVLLPDYEEELTKYPNSVYMVTGYSDAAEWNPETVFRILKVCKEHPENQYLFLTKRPYDIPFISDLDNVWLGTSVCRREDKSRIDTLRRLEFKHKFIAFEPVLERIGWIDVSDIDWISIGREIGVRPELVVPDPEWIKEIAINAVGTPILMKESLKEIVPEIYRQELPDQLMQNIHMDMVSQSYIDVIQNT